MKIIVGILAVSAAIAAAAQAPAPRGHQAHSGHPVRFSVYERMRLENWQWFAAPPANDTYSYGLSLLRIAASQKRPAWDWRLELAQAAIFDAPSDAVAPGSAQGQLGLGATYYVSNANNKFPAAAFLKQAYFRYHPGSENRYLSVGRFEYIEGQETRPANATLAWLQTNRIAHRLIGNFGFSEAQRSFDGLDAKYTSGPWTLSAMAARADQGVYNVNGNPELNVDVQYLALTRSAAKGHVLGRAFGIGYHDGRTGLTKTDNRPLGVRAIDHRNIRLGTYGGDLLVAAPVGPGTADFLFWGAAQNGNWGTQSHQAGAAAVEAGYRLTSAAAAPWLRAGWFRSTGDNNPADHTHSTFFQILPTPRIYARTPFYNLMNNTDEFVQLIDRPSRKLELRADLHGLQLTSAKDLWYLGGGAYDNTVFGYTGRTANGHHSFASMLDASADWQAASKLALNFYYARAWGRQVPKAIYPSRPNLQFGYVEMVFRWGE